MEKSDQQDQHHHPHNHNHDHQHDHNHERQKQEQMQRTARGRSQTQISPQLSTQEDTTRVCDCCYCEVFGHGVSPVAPTSRNYAEMRKRLRQRLSKKRRAEECDKSCPDDSKDDSSTDKGGGGTSTADQSLQVSNKSNARVVDQRNLDELLEFINGTGQKDNDKPSNKRDNSKNNNSNKNRNNSSSNANDKASSKSGQLNSKNSHTDASIINSTGHSPVIPATKRHQSNLTASNHSDQRPSLSSKKGAKYKDKQQANDPENSTSANVRRQKRKDREKSTSIDSPSSNSRDGSNNKNKNTSSTRSKSISSEPSSESKAELSTRARRRYTRLSVNCSSEENGSSSEAQLYESSDTLAHEDGQDEFEDVDIELDDGCDHLSSRPDDVFLPKSDIDLNDNDLNELERELEAFKRFCFDSMPLVKKERVRLDLKNWIQEDGGL